MLRLLLPFIYRPSTPSRIARLRGYATSKNIRVSTTEESSGNTKKSSYPTTFIRSWVAGRLRTPWLSRPKFNFVGIPPQSTPYTQTPNTLSSFGPVLHRRHRTVTVSFVSYCFASYVLIHLMYQRSFRSCIATSTLIPRNAMVQMLRLLDLTG